MLNELLRQRADDAIGNDPAASAARAAWYDFTGALECADRELFHHLDSLWIDCYLTIRNAAWLDGWQCGRNPDLLLYEPEGGYDR